MAGLSRTVVFPVLGLGLLGALAWEGRQYMAVRGDTGRSTPARDSAAVAPQGANSGAQ